jgi:hypothetical protein
MAGRKRLKNFLCHYPEISVRTPEGLTLSRARVFTPESVAQFFEIHEPAMGTIQHNPPRLYNCNETGIIIVQHKHMKILGMKGKHQISSVESAECGFLVTVITCTSSTSITCTSKKKYETRTDEWHTAWINPQFPSLRVDTE